MSDLHTHPRTDELAVFWIPAKKLPEPGLRVVENNFRALQPLVGGTLGQLPFNGPDLSCGCRIIMFGNEDGNQLKLTPNVRLMAVSDILIRGDVFLVGEGLVSMAGKTAADDEVEPDMFSLPQCFTQWWGPGWPIPTQPQPWEQRR